MPLSAAHPSCRERVDRLHHVGRGFRCRVPNPKHACLWQAAPKSGSLQDFQGKIGLTVAESVPWWPSADMREDVPPNILVILFDDTGWADFGCYGSEIRTPNVDALAKGGLCYNNFHVTPLCSPTRACLLTGRNHHSVGMSNLADTDTGFPNCRGAIRDDVQLLPQLLKQAGYATYMLGKWHLTPAHEITPAGPFGNWPTQRGFDRFYGFLYGCTDHYTPELIEDNHSVEPPIGDGYHLSEDLVDRAKSYLREHCSFRSQAPFFMNFCFGATHAPFQVPREYIEPYIDVFGKGWDRTREDRLAKQKALGLVPQETVLAERNPEVPAWADLDADAKTLYAHLQACFAGFLEHSDHQIGRLIDELKRLNLFENTLVLVMSDNGASREGGDHGAIDTNTTYSGQPESVGEMLPRLDQIGGRLGPAFYPQGWAMAGNTPFRRYKQFVELGGVRSPLVVHWPGSVEETDTVRKQFLHAIDITPTLLNLAGAPAGATVDGASFADTFGLADAPATRTVQHWEMFGRKAVYAGGWKAVSQHEKGDNYADDVWRLHDLSQDFSESRDLASEQPEKLQELQEIWWHEAHANSVFPLDDRTLVDIITFRQPNGIMAAREVSLYPGTAHVPQATMITSAERSMYIEANFSAPVADAEGVIISAGDSRGGYTFYIKNGRMNFEHVRMEDREVVSAPVDSGMRQCSVRLRVRPDASCSVVILVGNTIISDGEIPKVSIHQSFWGIDVGRDTGVPVTSAYLAPFAFCDKLLEKVVLRFTGERSASETAAAVQMTE